MRARDRQMNIETRRLLLQAIKEGERLARIVGAKEAWARRQSIMFEIEKRFTFELRED